MRYLSIVFLVFFVGSVSLGDDALATRFQAIKFKGQGQFILNALIDTLSTIVIKHDASMKQDEIDGLVQEFDLTDVEYLESLFVIIGQFDAIPFFERFLEAKVADGTCMIEQEILDCEISPISFYLGLNLFISDHYSQDDRVVVATPDFVLSEIE